MSRQLPLLISAGLVLLVLIAFEPLRYNTFITYDDNDYITENPQVRSGLTLSSIRWAFTTGCAANWHPLTWLSHMVDIELFDHNPAGHHLHNLALHIISTVLLFWILSRMTGSIWPSAFTALVFGIHPLRVESVAWAAERKDVLCALFWMLTIAAYLFYIKRGGLYRYLLMVLCFALGLMTKPMLVTLPIILLLLDYWPLNRFRVPDGSFRKFTASIRPLVLEKLPLFALAILSCFITFRVQRHGSSVATFEEFPLFFRILNVVTSYMEYIGKILWPKNLAILYPFPQDGAAITSIIIAVILILLISVYIFFVRHRKPYLVTGWIWYIISLIPVIGLVQTGSQRIADRYTYLPSIGIILMITWLAADFSAKIKYRRFLGIAVCGIIAAAMIFAIRIQLSYWQNSITLYKHTLAVTADNCIIENNLGLELLKINRIQEAHEHITKSLSIWPENPCASVNMAAILVRRNQPEEAMIYLNKTLKTEPHNSDALWYKGRIMEMLQKNDEAIWAYEQCVQYNPDVAEAFNNLGVLKGQKGLVDEAIDCFRRAIKIKPSYVDANRNLAVLLRSKGQLDEAAVYYRNVLQAEPDNYIVSYTLASIFMQTGHFHESIDYYRRTLQIKADYGPALNNLAWILAATQDSRFRNPQEAFNLSQKACELTQFKNPSCLDTMALAYAAQGQFDKAVETVYKAIELANEQGQSELALLMKKRLNLYQDSKPYYEPQPTQ